MEAWAAATPPPLCAVQPKNVELIATSEEPKTAAAPPPNAQLLLVFTNEQRARLTVLPPAPSTAPPSPTEFESAKTQSEALNEARTASTQPPWMSAPFRRASPWSRRDAPGCTVKCLDPPAASMAHVPAERRRADEPGRDAHEPVLLIETARRTCRLLPPRVILEEMTMLAAVGSAKAATRADSVPTVAVEKPEVAGVAAAGGSGDVLGFVEKFAEKPRPG